MWRAEEPAARRDKVGRVVTERSGWFVVRVETGWEVIRSWVMIDLSHEME